MDKIPFSRYTTVLLVFCCFTSVIPIAIARSISEIKQSGVLKVAVDGMTPLFNYYNKDELTGFEVDLAKEIAKKLGFKIEWTVQPFNTLLIGIQQDRFDLIATPFCNPCYRPEEKGPES